EGTEYESPARECREREQRRRESASADGTRAGDQLARLRRDGREPHSPQGETRRNDRPPASYVGDNEIRCRKGPDRRNQEIFLGTDSHPGTRTRADGKRVPRTQRSADSG